MPPAPSPEPEPLADLPVRKVRGGTPGAYYELTKPGIAGYVMITAGVTYYVATGGRAELWPAVHTMVGTGLATAGALALNQYVERDFDAVMHRTRTRPLPSGRLRPGAGLAFGSILLAAGLIYLFLLTGRIPALIAVLSAAAYHGVYTPLKSHSYLATLAGAVPGALPTLIGWTAGAGGVGPGGWSVFSIAYLWQIPHVLGLAWILREDYTRVGFKLIPGGGGRIIGTHMVLATALLLPVSLLPTLLHITGRLYLAGAGLAGILFLAQGIRAARHLTDATARGVFFGSLVYHPVILGLMLVDTIRL